VVTASLEILQTSLAEQVAELRGEPADSLPATLLDVVVCPVELPGGTVYLMRPSDWEALREDEGAAARQIPYWARLWPSGFSLAVELAKNPPAPGMRVLELGCGLGLPSVVAARAGAEVLATDGSEDAVAFTAHNLALNELEGRAARADWQAHGGALIEEGPFDLVLAADVLYTIANKDAALELLPRLVAADGEIRLADPDRANARTFLQAARKLFEIHSAKDGDVRLHSLRAHGLNT
jgi:predicted nicotinamide N-methyase